MALKCNLMPGRADRKWRRKKQQKVSVNFNEEFREEKMLSSSQKRSGSLSKLQLNCDQECLLSKESICELNSKDLNLFRDSNNNYKKLLRRAQSEDLSEVSGIGFFYCSGHDSENRPIIVLIGKWFPFRKIDLEKTVMYIIYLLDKNIKGDYIVAYFHSLTKSGNYPTFSWISELYNLLPYQYKKHLKAFYIVHPTIWTKLATWWFTTFTASSIKKKVHNVNKLEHLYSSIKWVGMEIPAFITEHDMSVLSALSISLGSMIVGFTSAYTSPALTSMKKSSTFEITDEQGSWIGALMPLAALIGSIAGGPMIENLGRKFTILLTPVPFAISYLLIFFATNVSLVYAGRIIAGVCVGIASLSFPVYLAEALEPEVRGVLGLMPTSFGNIGILVCFTVGSYLNWSWLALVGAILPLPFLISVLLIPEVPHWYLSKNKINEAYKSLCWLRGSDTNSPALNSEFNELKKAQSEMYERTNWSDLVQRNNMMPLLIAIGLMFFQQMSGINAIIFYTVHIFEKATNSIDENLSTVIIGIVNCLSIFIATLLIDRLGRKVLLYLSSALMCLSLLMLALFFHAKELIEIEKRFTDYEQLFRQVSVLPLVSCVLFIVGFSLGFGPVPWLMMGEILPSKIRGGAASLVTCFNWTCTFAVTKAFTNISNLLSIHGAFYLFSTISFLAAVFVYRYVPETRGMTLEEIENGFFDSNNNRTGHCLKSNSGEECSNSEQGTGFGPDTAVVHSTRNRRLSSVANFKPLPFSV